MAAEGITGDVSENLEPGSVVWSYIIERDSRGI